MIATFSERVYPPIGDLLIAQIERMKQRWIAPEHKEEVDQLSSVVNDSMEQYTQIPGSTDLFPTIRRVTADVKTTTPEFDNWPLNITDVSIEDIDSTFDEIENHPNVSKEKFRHFLNHLRNHPTYHDLTLRQIGRYESIARSHGIVYDGRS